MSTPTYKTFLRTCKNWEQFASARKTTKDPRKTTKDRGLSHEEARRRCEEYNKNRTPAQIKAGTKMEFTTE